MGNKNVAIKWSSENSEIVEFTKPDIMLKLVSTIDPKGRPHLTIITSNRAINKSQIVWGEFTIGTSKANVQSNPKQGIFYMTAEMPFKCIQVKVDFSHTKMEGEDIESFNRSNLMRYMTYMNIYKVYYSNIKSVSPIRRLPLGGIVNGLLKNAIGKNGAKTGLNEKRLNAVGYKLFKGPVNPKFIAYLDPSDGYPLIVPCIQLQAVDHNRLAFPLTVFKSDLEAIPQNCKVAVLGMNMDLANQVVKGTYLGIQKFRGIKFGIVDIEEIYNSSPPIPGVIYPTIQTRPKISEFHL